MRRGEGQARREKGTALGGWNGWTGVETRNENVQRGEFAAAISNEEERRVGDLKCGQRHMRLACSTSNLYWLLLMFVYCDIRRHSLKSRRKQWRDLAGTRITRKKIPCYVCSVICKKYLVKDRVTAAFDMMVLSISNREHFCEGNKFIDLGAKCNY